MKTLIESAGRAALNLIFPPNCAGCGSDLHTDSSKTDARFCIECLDQIPSYKPPYCSRCGCECSAMVRDGCSHCHDRKLHCDQIRRDGRVYRLTSRSYSENENEQAAKHYQLRWEN